MSAPVNPTAAALYALEHYVGEHGLNISQIVAKFTEGRIVSDMELWRRLRAELDEERSDRSPCATAHWFKGPELVRWFEAEFGESIAPKLEERDKRRYRAAKRGSAIAAHVVERWLEATDRTLADLPATVIADTPQ